MPLHVSSTCVHHQQVKIVYTASGIITPIGARLVRGFERGLIVKQILCIKLVTYWNKHTEMHGQQNVKTMSVCLSSCCSYPARKPHIFCPVLYCYLWPVWLYRVLSHYFVQGTTFGKRFIEQKMCFDFMYNFPLKHFSFWEELSEIP